MLTVILPQKHNNSQKDFAFSTLMFIIRAMNARLSSNYLNTAAGIMFFTGWGGLFFLIRNVVPDAGARWLFFVFLYIAVVGTTLPFIRFLNNRFNAVPDSVPDWVILRQSLWSGLYVTTCAWLQIPRVLNPVLALLYALVLIVIEVFLRFRERAISDYES